MQTERIEKNQRLIEWIDAEWELPTADNVVLAVVNGKLGSITFVNAIELAQYFEGEGWLLDSFLDVDAGSGDGIEIKWWAYLPEPPEECKTDDK